MRIGILGGGQLGRMLAIAGYPLGMKFTFLDPSADAPMAPLARGIVADYNDPAALEELASSSDVVTWEFENVGFAAVDLLTKRTQLFPPASALNVKHDRLFEKQFFDQLKIPTARYANATTRSEFDSAMATIGFPLVVKSRKFGYDGKGQAVLRDPSHSGAVWDALKGAAVIVEELISFEREVSILSVRGRDGATAFYPITENLHKSGILRHSVAPAPNISDSLRSEAQQYANRILDHLQYAGVLAIEFFQVNGRLLANELAPRVHNSGHWTIDGAATSQFENHLRAIAGLPLGSTHARCATGMVNIIGGFPNISKIISIPGTRLHLYGKAARPGRKLGHVNICNFDGEPWTVFEQRMRDVASMVE
ncbi:MAG: 5-(carboxyamino)imidazole ribonucleotide synthase [Planctomycetota bacterium]